jgi:uncharacterized OsmC-like protein
MNNATLNKTTNGIDTETQQKIMDMMTGQPELAIVTFKASNDWKGATRSRSEFKTFTAAGQEHNHAQTHVVESDLPNAFLGSDQNATPGEYALHALAACMNSTMVYNCAARGITVRSSRVRISGDLDARGFMRLSDEVSAGYKQIRIKFYVDADASEEVIRDLVEGTPMFNTFAHPVPMAVSINMA